MPVNALRIIIWNKIAKALVKMVDKGSDFITYVAFVIFCVVRKFGDFVKYLQISI